MQSDVGTFGRRTGTNRTFKFGKICLFEFEVRKITTDSSPSYRCRFVKGLSWQSQDRRRDDDVVDEMRNLNAHARATRIGHF